MTAGPDHPLRVETAANGEPRPISMVRGGLEARLARPVFYDLVELGFEERVGDASLFGVWSNGCSFRSATRARLGLIAEPGRGARIERRIGDARTGGTGLMRPTDP